MVEFEIIQMDEYVELEFTDSSMESDSSMKFYWENAETAEQFTEAIEKILLDFDEGINK